MRPDTVPPRSPNRGARSSPWPLRLQGGAARRWGLLAPLPAIAVGASAAAAHGIALRAFAPNVAAVVVGIAGARLLDKASTARREVLASVLPWIVVAAAGATLAGPGLAGVHRWVGAGPILLNVSEAVTSLILVGLGSGARPTRERGALALVAMQVVHLAQPDAAQATAVAAAVLPLFVGGAGCRWWIAGATLLAVVAMACLAWTRPDALPEVEHVEGILRLVAERGTRWALAATLAGVVAVGALVLAAWAPGGSGRCRAAALGLVVVAPAACAALGNYPVPLFGAGAGSVLGWYAAWGTAGFLRACAPSPHAAEPRRG